MSSQSLTLKNYFKFHVLTIGCDNKNELGFVNFENVENILDIVLSRNEQIAKLLQENIQDLVDNYQILSLRPLAEIIANNFQHNIKKGRIFTIKELNNESTLFTADFHMLRYAMSISELKETFIKRYVDSIKETNKYDIERAARAVAVLHPTTRGPIVNWGYGYGIELIAVIPNDNKLLNRKIEPISTNDYDKIRQILFKNNLIEIRTDEI